MTVFCTSLILLFAGVVHVFSDDFEMVSLAPVITGITFFLHYTFAVILL